MKRLHHLVIIVTLLFIAPSLQAQREADSLRFKALRDSIIQVIGNRDLDKGILMSENLLREAEEKEFPFFMIEAHIQLSRAYGIKNEIDVALEELKKSVKIAEEQQVHETMGVTYNNLAMMFFRESSYDSALVYFHKNVDLAREHIPDRLAFNLVNLAWIYGNIDDREKEFEAYLATLEALEANPESKRKVAVKAMVLGGIGDYYVFTRNFDKAKENFEKKLAHGKEHNNIWMQFEAHAGLGNLYRLDEFYDFERSKYHYEQTAYAEQSEDNHYKYQALQALAKLYRKEGMMSEALSKFKLVFNYYKGLGVDDFSASAATAIGELYLQTGELSKADEWLNTAVKDTKRKNLIARERDALRSLYKVDSIRGRYRSALTRFQRLNHIEDSLMNERSINRIKELEIQFETEQTEKENLTLKSDLELKEAQVERQQIIQIFVVIVAITFIVLATVVWRSYQRKKKDNETISQQAEALKTLSRFKDGLTSMVVHDMRNPLNAILGFSQGTPTDNKLRNINRSGHQVLNLVNNMLDIQRFEEARVELNPEIIDAKILVADTINEVTLLAASKSLRITNRVSDQLRFKADPVLVNRVLVNLLINSVKYSKSGTEIVVEAGQGEAGFQQLIVRDQGHGILPEQLPHIFEKFWHNDPEKSGVLPSTGLGLSFCKMAIEAHGGEIYAESVLHEGTSIFFSLPLADAAQVVNVDSLEEELKESVLNEKDLEIYQQYLPKFEKLQVFEISEINKLIKSLQDRVTDKKLWAQLRTAAFQGDQPLYNQLLDQIRERKVA